MASVYISSTYQDLVEERKAVWRAVQELNHQPVGMETYGADEKTVIERCSDDIESCGAYVLIVGWRYGWQPTGHDGKSITEIEWEAAARAGVRRFVYLQDDATEPPASLFGKGDRKRVREFRTKLREPDREMSGVFDTVDKLEKRILVDLGPVLGRGVEFPRDLRVTCDRQPQVVELAQAWVDGWQGRAPKRGPIVVLAHGGVEQGYDYFAQRFARLELPRLPRRAGASPAIPEPIRLDWHDAPDPARFANAMQFALRHALSSESREMWDASSFVARSIPLVVGVEVPPGAWKKKLPLVEAYARSWFQPPLEALEAPTIALVYVRSKEKAVAVSLAQLAESLSKQGHAVLALEFHSVGKPEALSWARSESVTKFCRQRDATTEVERVFAKRERWEMEPLMKKLEVIACKLAEGVGARR